MAQVSRPWPMSLLGDGKRYTPAEWGRVIFTKAGLDNYLQEERGPQAGQDNELRVEPTVPASLGVWVREGSAFVGETWYRNTAPVNLQLAPNTSGLARYDRVVVRKLWAQQTVRATVLSGLPGAGYPGLTHSSGVQWEIPLALIMVASGAVNIAAANITDERGLIRERRLWLGLGDWDSSSFTIAPVNDAAGVPTSTEAWFLFTLAFGRIVATMQIPQSWGEGHLLTLYPYIWWAGIGLAQVNLWARTYFHGDVAGNLNLIGTAVENAPAWGVHRASIPFSASTLQAWPGQIINILLVAAIPLPRSVFGLELLALRM